jgi:hypothetical protein
MERSIGKEHRASWKSNSKWWNVVRVDGSPSALSVFVYRNRLIRVVRKRKGDTTLKGDSWKEGIRVFVTDEVEHASYADL